MAVGVEILSIDLIFFEYITIERLELQKTVYDRDVAISQCIS